VRRVIAGFYKRPVNEYKNILIYPFDRRSPPKKQGDKPVPACFNPVQKGACQP
jgi:hypothetical protein